MSWAEENLIDIGVPDDFYEDYDEQRSPFFTSANGTLTCKRCGNQEIKTSKNGNEYCSKICWVKEN